MIRRFVVTATVDGSGDAEVYSPVLSGKLESIRYVKTDYDDGVDFTITAEATGETLWAQENVTASATVHPRAALQGTDGADALYAALGEAVNGKIALGQDRVKIVIASGTGDAGGETGTFHITIDG